MVTIEFPNTPQDISANWLTDVLRQAGAITSAAVKEVEIQTIAVGQGFTTQIGRLTVQYDCPDSQAPRSMIVKVPTLHEATRQAVAAGYEREVRFYDQLPPHIPLRVPHCYFSALDSETGNFVLLLEDLTTTATSRQIELGGFSMEEADFVVRQLATLHATW